MTAQDKIVVPWGGGSAETFVKAGILISGDKFKGVVKHPDYS